jgi:DNA-binding transcriptional ArsR family regulator
MATRPLSHPPIENISVAGILYALSEPVRLAMFSEILKSDGSLSCCETVNKIEVKMPKSTCSQHFQILREAGLIFSERKGVELENRTRYEEVEKVFPNLLSSILKSNQLEQKKSEKKVRKKK